MQSNDRRVPPDAELKDMAEALIHGQSTMTLATAENSRAWAAPVYYAFRGGSFYFFSDPESRHVRESLAGSGTAAAVFAASDAWRGIRGLQMSGRIIRVSPGIEALKAVQSYIRKFAFTREFFKPGERLDVEAFSERFRVRLYAFKPELIYYLDNSIRFGFKQAIKL